MTSLTTNPFRNSRMMTRRTALAGLVGTALGTFDTRLLAQTARPKKKVIVELFTSQG